MSDSRATKSRRNLRALLALGFLFALLAAVGGGAILTLAYSHPSVEQPLWKFGQCAMFLGLVNLVIYLVISFQIRSLIRGFVDHDAT